MEEIPAKEDEPSAKEIDQYLPENKVDCEKKLKVVYNSKYTGMLLEQHECKKNLNCTIIEHKGKTYGFIKKISSVAKEGKNNLYIYELTWDLTTRWAKDSFTKNDQNTENKRFAINDIVKTNIINDSLSDAVLYLGEYKTSMQFPFLMALCRIFSDEVEDVFKCYPEQIKEIISKKEFKDFSDKNHIVVMTHSLGTRIFFDTLGLLSDDDLYGKLSQKLGYEELDSKDNKLVKGDFKKLFKEFSKSLFRVYTFANQIPLLELGEVTHYDDNAQLRHAKSRQRAKKLTLTGLRDKHLPLISLGTSFEGFITKRNNFNTTVLEVMAFSDPNDLLTYDLKCWYFSNVVRFNKNNKDKFNIIKGTLRELIDKESKTKTEGSINKLDDWNKQLTQAYNFYRQCSPDYKIKFPGVDDDYNNELSVKKHWQNVQDRIVFNSVEVNFANWYFPKVFAEVGSAHSKYFENKCFFKFIANHKLECN